MVTSNAFNFGTGTAGQILTSNGSGISPTFQSLAALDGVPSIPGWINTNSSLWWSPTPYTGTGNLGVTANTIYAMPFLTYGSFTITAVGITCGFYSFASSLEFALYLCSPGGGAALVSSLGTVSVTSSGLKTITGLTQQVSADWHYLCFQPSNGSNQYSYASQANTACLVNKTDSGDTIGQVRYAKGTAGFPASISTTQFSSTLSTNSYIMLIQGA